MADEDERRCKTCGKLHGTRYPVNVTMPVPAHPNCRCCIIPVVRERETIDILIDKFVPCLEDATTGEILPTIAETIDKEDLFKYNKSTGWLEDWDYFGEKDYTIKAVKIKNSDVVEGLIAYTVNHGVVYIGYVENAPHNSPFIENPKYLGVGGHLFAIAAKQAINDCGGAMYAFASERKLLDYYQEKLYAEYIGVLHEYHIAWD